MPAYWRPTLAYALEIVDLTAGYDGLPIVRDFSARIATGTVTTLIGGNGAGKSTLMRAIYGSNRWFSGQIVFEGRAIERLPPWERLKLGIGFVPQGREIFARLTVEENLRMGAYSRNDSAAIEADLERVYTMLPRIKERLPQVAGTLSGGEQQMVAIGRALLSRPRLLLLDEPSMGLAPLVVEKIFEVVQSVAREGVTILLVEQNANLALEFAQRGYVMESGKITLTGSGGDLLANPKVRAAYLGEEA